MNTKISSFTDLNTWKEAHKLVLQIYILTKKFPKEEAYSLTDQIRRCTVSISSNIAEGFSRQSKKEKLQFYYTSKGSLTELQNQILIARDVGYINKEEFSNSQNSNIQKWSAFVSGTALRQDFLECALDWVSKGNISDYMSRHRKDENINEYRCDDGE